MSRRGKTAGDYLHRRMIRLRCARCKRTQMALRQDYDPPNAATMLTAFCDKCDRGGEYDLNHYFDMHGKEVVPE